VIAVIHAEMIGVGQLLTLTIWLIAIILGLAFGGFIHKASKGEVKWNTVFKTLGGILKTIANPVALLSLALIVAGICLIGSAVSYHYIQVTTGYKYSLLSSSSKYYVPELERIVTMPAYTLWESPVVTTQVLTFFDTGRVLLGLWLIVIGLIVGAWGSVKATNRAFEVS
jgi:hypothetical protein